MSEIVDLILPKIITQMQLELKIYEAVEKYLSQNNRQWSETSIIDNIAPIKIIRDKIVEANQTTYNFDFWLNVERLNRDKMVKINKILLVGSENIHFEDRIDFMTTQKFKLNEIDLINKQYRLLQEIYYSRLEAKK